jgi:hypothetical protein
MANKSSSIDSTSQLQDAIRKLEAFSQQAVEDKSRSPVSKTIALVRSLLLKSFEFESNKRAKKRQQSDENEVLAAIEVINRKRLLIQRLEAGSPDEQKLADSFTRAIGIYNQIQDKRTQARTLSAKGRRKLFSAENAVEIMPLPKIDLPQQHTVEFHYPENTPKLKSKRTVSAVQQKKASIVPLSKQSADLFYMKALSLLERYGIATNPEARAIVRQSPILTVIDGDDATCTLTQTLTLFPGQTVVVIGTSALDPKTQTIHQLFPDTFSVSLESTQTGYPHPSQRAGWTLAHQLLHDCPQRIDLLTKAAELLQTKKEVIQGLLPHGSLIGKAKKLFKYKALAFAEHQQEFLDLHRRLALAIFQSAPKHDVPHHAEITASTYFDMLKNQLAPFNGLVDTYQCIREHAITKPHQVLLNAILMGKSNDIGNNDAMTRYHAAQAILDQALDNSLHEIELQAKGTVLPLERAKFEFIYSMGKVLGSAAETVMLQYLSEDLMYPPPALKRFEQKIQAAAYRHVEDFFDELAIPLEGDYAQNQKSVYHLLKNEMNWDLSLFQQDQDLEIPEELALYFDRRYLSLSSL